MKANARRLERFCEVIHALKSRPMSAAELAGHLTAERNTVARYLRVLSANKLIEIHGRGESRRGVKPLAWRWVP